MDIESKAVSAINDKIADINRLKSFITQNDKTPAYDGSIAIYKNDSTKNENMDSSVRVQVKGRETDDLSLKNIEYPVDISNLKIYLNDGGVLFFVVLIHKETKETKIYYNSLLPFRINFLLKNLRKSQKTKSITLKRFPQSENDIIELLVNFSRDSSKQCNVRNIGVLSLEELKNRKEPICKLQTFYYATKENTSSAADCIFEKEMYQYAVSTTGIFYPIAQVSLSEILQEIKADVICKNEKVFEKFVIKRTNNSIYIIIGESITLTLEKGALTKGGNATITFSPNGSISNRIKASNLMLDILNENEVQIGGAKILNITKENPSPIDENEIKKNISFLENVQKACVKAGIDAENISEENVFDVQTLQFLIDVFIKNEPKSLETNVSEKESFGLLSIGQKNMNLLIFAKNIHDKIYKISNYFYADFSSVMKNDNGLEYAVSRYVPLKKEHFAKALNIQYDEIAKDVFKYEHTEQYHYNVTLMLLEMINAFDETGTTALYKAIIDVAEWLQKFNGTEKEKDLSDINYIQCKKRKEPINDTDKLTLYRICEKNVGEDIKLACYILLDMKEKAKEVFDNLDSKTKEIFEKFPIYTLYRKMF